MKFLKKVFGKKETPTQRAFCYSPKCDKNIDLKDDSLYCHDYMGNVWCNDCMEEEMKQDKFRILIDSLFEYRNGFTISELISTIDKNGLIVEEPDTLIQILLSQGMIKSIDSNKYIVTRS